MIKCLVLSLGLLAGVLNECTVSYEETQTQVIGRTECFHIVRRNKQMNCSSCPSTCGASGLHWFTSGDRGRRLGRGNGGKVGVD